MAILGKQFSLGSGPLSESGTLAPYGPTKHLVGYHLPTPFVGTNPNEINSFVSTVRFPGDRCHVITVCQFITSQRIVGGGNNPAITPYGPGVTAVVKYQSKNQPGNPVIPMRIVQVAPQARPDLSAAASGRLAVTSPMDWHEVDYNGWPEVAYNLTPYNGWVILDLHQLCNSIIPPLPEPSISGDIELDIIYRNQTANAARNACYAGICIELNQWPGESYRLGHPQRWLRGAPDPQSDALRGYPFAQNV